MQGLSVRIVPAWECLEYSVPTRKLLFGLILVREGARDERTFGLR